MKKKVIAYLHTHWDREWYREFEVFRLRLIRVFDNVLDLLQSGKIPSFYFDGQVSALLDYLELRPENEPLIRKLIKEKKLFIGPCYTLVDEYLTTKECFEKNLEIGIKISKDFGCTDFIGYLADTFGHSKNIPEIFKNYGIDKCVVWRGCPDIPSEFKFCGINTVNLIRGYFMDIFSAPITIEQKAKWLKDNLDKIAEKSENVLLLPIGADHLGVEPDISKQIKMVNNLLDNYEIELSNPFKYFELVKNIFKYKWNDELRDNSKTFILQGCYSARANIKRYNAIACYKLKIADEIQKALGNKYFSAIEYAYKLLLKNQAHDGICGCSTDEVHLENITRYKKVIQVAETILKELEFIYPKEFGKYMLSIEKNCRSVIEFESENIKEKNSQMISSRKGFIDDILYNTQRIPITEDYTTIYKHLKQIKPNSDILKVTNNSLENSHVKLTISKSGKIKLNNISIDFIRYNDKGDTYNFGAVKNDICEIAKVIDSKILLKGEYRCGLKIKTTFFEVLVYLDKNSELLKFHIDWDNKYKNKIWQVSFGTDKHLTNTYSLDLGKIITRKFDPYYDIKKHLPKTKGIEVKTNTAPMNGYVGVDEFGIITKGLTEYEVNKKALRITILRSIGVISNPKNPCRTTPAGPPLEVIGAQQSGKNTAEFAIGFFKPQKANQRFNEFMLEEIL